MLSADCLRTVVRAFPMLLLGLLPVEAGALSRAMWAEMNVLYLVNLRPLPECAAYRTRSLELLRDSKLGATELDERMRALWKEAKAKCLNSPGASEPSRATPTNVATAPHSAGEAASPRPAASAAAPTPTTAAPVAAPAPVAKAPAAASGTSGTADKAVLAAAERPAPAKDVHATPAVPPAGMAAGAPPKGVAPQGAPATPQPGKATPPLSVEAKPAATPVPVPAGAGTGPRPQPSAAPEGSQGPRLATGTIAAGPAGDRAEAVFKPVAAAKPQFKPLIERPSVVDLRLEAACAKRNPYAYQTTSEDPCAKLAQKKIAESFTGDGAVSPWAWVIGGAMASLLGAGAWFGWRAWARRRAGPSDDESARDVDEQLDAAPA